MKNNTETKQGRTWDMNPGLLPCRDGAIYSTDLMWLY